MVLAEGIQMSIKLIDTVLVCFMRKLPDTLSKLDKI